MVIVKTKFRLFFRRDKIEYYKKIFNLIAVTSSTARRMMGTSLRFSNITLNLVTDSNELITKKVNKIEI
jgi:hypothetical protein